jgi:hypothetical protein
VTYITPVITHTKGAVIASLNLEFDFSQRTNMELGVVVHSCKTSSWEVEAEEWQVQGWPGHSKTLS